MSDQTPTSTPEPGEWVCDERREVGATAGTPQVFIDALLRGDAPNGTHRVVYLDTSTGKRTTSFITLGPQGGSQVRSYVLFPYLMAKDLRTEVDRPDPWEAMNGLGAWPDPAGTGDQ